MSLHTGFSARPSALPPEALYGPPAGPRERMLATAYELFKNRGIRGVGVDELIGGSSVAKATFYRYFPSKDDLVLAFLERREQVWLHDLIVAEAARSDEGPDEQLLMIFEALQGCFLAEDFEGCSFVKVLLEMGPDHPLGRASTACLERITEHLASLARAAGLLDPAGVARSLMVLVTGAVVSALAGDGAAAARARIMARALLEAHR